MNNKVRVCRIVLILFAELSIIYASLALYQQQGSIFKSLLLGIGMALVLFIGVLRGRRQ